MTTQDWEASINRVRKWRTLLAGWRLGTRPKGDPESDAVRDAAEARIILRVEVSALAALLLKKGVFTQKEYTHQLGIEADFLNEAFVGRWPGVTATDEGYGAVVTPPINADQQ